MAVRTKEAFKSTKNSRYADNTTGAITAANSRDMFEDAADSFAFAADVASVGLLSSTTAISSAEILALNTTPKVLIAAPGAGKYIQVLHGHIFLDFASAYSNTTTEIEYATGRDIIATITGFLNVGVDTLYNFAAGGPTGPFAWSEYENSAVRYRATSADPTGGTSTISINLIYRIVTI